MSGREHAPAASAADEVATDTGPATGGMGSDRVQADPMRAERVRPGAEATTKQWVVDAVDRHEQGLLQFVSRIVGDIEQARDVVQHAFMRLLGQKREAIEPHLAEWLYTVSRNRALDIRRKGKRQKPLDDRTSETFAHRAPLPLEAAEQKDAMARVMRMLLHLPPNQQEVIRLRFGSGLSYKEISGVTRLSVTNVGFLIHTGLATLREKMGTERNE